MNRDTKHLDIYKDFNVESTENTQTQSLSRFGSEDPDSYYKFTKNMSLNK